MNPAALFRPATKADASALAVLVDIAGEGMPAYMWSTLAAPGQSVLEFGRERAQRDSGGFSWRNAVVAEIGGEVAACLVGYRLDDPYDLGALAGTPEIVQPLVKLEAKSPGSWYVNVLATFPEFRRRGIGAKLLAIAERRGARECACSERDRRKLERGRHAPLRPRRLCRRCERARHPVSRISQQRRLGLDGEVAPEWGRKEMAAQ